MNSMRQKVFVITTFLIISCTSLIILLGCQWWQKQPDWMTCIQQIMAAKKYGQFVTTDKFGDPVALEWVMLDPQTAELSKKMKSISDIVIQAYTPVEMQYLRQHPEAVAYDFMFKELEPLFDQGIEKVDWNVVEEKIKAKLKQLVEVDFASIFGANTVNIFVVIKDKKTQKQLGVVQFLINPECAYGNVSVPVLGMIPKAQHRGLGKLLLSSIFKLLPTIKRIFLATRVTNEQAMNAYRSWGFTPDPKSGAPEKGWIGFEYRTDQSEILQKAATQLF